MKCRFCLTDKATMKHHKIPRSLGGVEIIDCCTDCGNQVHMLFTNKELAKMSFIRLMNSDKMKIYIEWKKKHPGKHTYRASRKVKEWAKNHRN